MERKKPLAQCQWGTESGRLPIDAAHQIMGRMNAVFRKCRRHNRKGCGENLRQPELRLRSCPVSTGCLSSVYFRAL